ncbi:chemokine CCL-CUb precursor, partial [Silurus asotus]
DAEKVSPCCVAVSRYMENIPITGYRLQERNIPCVRAVIFKTEKGQFCIDPNQPWVKRKIIEFWKSLKNKISPTSAPLIQTSSATENSTVHSGGKTTNHSSLH